MNMAFLQISSAMLLAVQLLWTGALASFDRPSAFIGTPCTSRARSRSAVASALQLSKDNTQHHDSGVSRRDVFRSTALLGAATLAKPSSARAATEIATKTKSTPTVVSNTLCDPSVSTWVKKYDDANLRTVHILGTAHISSASAELAGQLVRDIKPNVVFVELDAKRVTRALPGAGKGGSNFVSSSAASTDNSLDDGKELPQPATSAAITSTPSDTSDSPKRSNPLETKLVNAGSKVVGNSVKSMYGKLESEGFKAGDEFAMSVREGLALGSTIVLGDRDVEVTLQRLTKALTKTDIRKLLSADSEVEKSMEELLPEGMKSQLKQPTAGGGGSSGDNSMNVSNMGKEDVTISRAEFTSFVETMKAKENVKKIMSALQKTAPEIYEAMVAERDRYMARGLDELGLNLKGKSVDDTVAVVGMAHVDGIERYLAGHGWTEMIYPCPVVR